MVMDVIMPQLGETVSEGKVSVWHAKVGDEVSTKTPLFDVSSDKVEMEVPAPAEGTLLEIRIEAGATVPVGEVVALHRQPTPTGVCRRGGGRLWSTGRLGATCEDIVGNDFPESGRLFAVEGDTVYVLQGNQVVAWDGQRSRPLGTPSAAMASLMLAWSAR